VSQAVAGLISLTRINLNIELASKKRALETLSQLLCSAQSNLTTEEIFACLLRREKLGSTSIGNGVALPHGRLKGLNKAVGAFITLAQPVDYQSNDDTPVDVLFAMLAPEETDQSHIDALNSLSSLFANTEFIGKLKSAANTGHAAELLSNTAIDAH